MRLIGVLALSLAACGSGDDGFQVGGPGTDGGFTRPDGNGGGGNDALVDSLDATAAVIDANLFDGRVCLLTDPRQLNVCASTGAGGLTVRLGTATTTTADDGTFVIAGQSGDLVWRITGSNIVSSFEPLKDYFIPAITKTAFNSMLSSSSPSVMQVQGEGSLMLFVTENASGASGHFVGTSPSGFYNTYYDNAASASAWQQSDTGTGTYGAAWMPGIDVGTVNILVDGTTPNAASPKTAPIFDGGITFGNIIL